eukprot:gb/GECG01015344.1/.p1 GENE.gb/GECG01015344.1/~~gb/GECG01015344.1/.p1  ORF type:complete len:443 (+),score=78.61 gb/GECG01015344.1/:1-1329(+)
MKYALFNSKLFTFCFALPIGKTVCILDSRKLQIKRSWERESTMSTSGAAYDSRSSEEMEDAMKKMGLDPGALDDIPSDHEGEKEDEKLDSEEKTGHRGTGNRLAEDAAESASSRPSLISKDSPTRKGTKGKGKRSPSPKKGRNQTTDSPKHDASTGEASNLHTRVAVRGEMFKVPCGNGEQDIKWLANVATDMYMKKQKNRGTNKDQQSSQQRLGLLEKYRNRRDQANGTSKTNEKSYANRLEKGEIKDGYLKPKCVRHRLTSTFSNDMVGPALKIKDVMKYLAERSKSDAYQHSGCQDLMVLDVELDVEETLEPDNSRNQTLWSALAHNFSDEGQRRAEALRDRFVRDLKNRAKDTLVSYQKATKQKVERLLNLITVENTEDEIAMERAMKADWSVFRLDRVTNLREEAQETKRFIITNFLCKFAFYWRVGLCINCSGSQR